MIEVFVTVSEIVLVCFATCLFYELIMGRRK